jgi:hypothetical protein
VQASRWGLVVLLPEAAMRRDTGQVLEIPEVVDAELLVRQR